MSNQNERIINPPLRSDEIEENPVYTVKATTDLLAAKVADTGTAIQMKGGEHTVQTTAIASVQAGEKLQLMQCNPFPGDTHATFQTMPDDGLFPLVGVVSLEAVESVKVEEQVA